MFCRLLRTFASCSFLLLACAPTVAPAPPGAVPGSAQAAKEPIGPETTVAPAEGEQPVPLPQRLDELLAAEFLIDASVGVSIIALPSRQPIYEYKSGEPLNPASNVKLVTSAAALATLGPEHRYYTRVYALADSMVDGIVAGDLYLQGSGDPQLVTANLYELARSLWTDGLRRVKGRLLVDSTRFDADGLPPGFDQKDEFASYRAPIGATSVNFNTFVVEIRPAKAVDTPVIVTVDPPVPSVVIANEARTTAGRRNRLSVTAERRDGALILAIAGDLGLDANGPDLRYPVVDPSRYAGEVFLLALRDVGITVDDRSVRPGVVPSNAMRLGSHRSAQLGAHLRAVNKLSNNFMAEQILRTLAPEQGATAQASLQRVRDYLVGTGMPAEGLSIGNGSGLYDNNRISAGQITHLLATMASDFRYGPEFLAALSIMGVDGTAKSRLRSTEFERWVRAKTGTLDGVSSLSGYVGTASGETLAFSILMNGFAKQHASAARDLQDEIVKVVAAAAFQPSP